jgi:hypothetical protein
MAGQVDLSAGDPRVCTAVALGWQVAQLFHSPVHRGEPASPPMTGQLPGRSEFPGATQSLWLGEQIETYVRVLFPALAIQSAVTRVLSDVLSVLRDSGRQREPTLEAIFALHCQLLEAVSTADFRLGKAYGLGRALAETALIPADTPAEEDRARQFTELLEGGRLITIKDWLFDLKTLLPDHAAYAVIRSLDVWQGWAAGPSFAAGAPSARGQIRIQGRVWRELLTGEKAGQDMLNLSYYLAAARNVAGRVWASLWHFKRLLALAMLMLVGAIALVLFVKGISPSVRLVAGLAWLAGALGLSVKGAGALLGGALANGEGWLWQSELDEAVALSAICPPPGETPRPVPHQEVGNLALSTDRSAEQQRRDLMRDQALGSAGL